MKAKDIILIAGAVGAGAQAASGKVPNPTVSAILIFVGMGLAWWADHPRSENGRSTDDQN